MAAVPFVNKVDSSKMKINRTSFLLLAAAIVIAIFLGHKSITHSLPPPASIARLDQTELGIKTNSEPIEQKAKAASEINQTSSLPQFQTTKSRQGKIEALL